MIRIAAASDISTAFQRFQTRQCNSMVCQLLTQKPQSFTWRLQAPAFTRPQNLKDINHYFSSSSTLPKTYNSIPDSKNIKEHQPQKQTSTLTMFRLHTLTIINKDADVVTASLLTEPVSYSLNEKIFLNVEGKAMPQAPSCSSIQLQAVNTTPHPSCCTHNKTTVTSRTSSNFHHPERRCNFPMA
jgi:hypothetical protein